MVAISPGAHRLACLLLAGAWSLIFTAAVAACETPVFRYAMYRWEPTPYEVYFFHDKPADEVANRVAEMIVEASEKTPQRANVVHLPVDVSADPELNSIPPDVKKAWLERGVETLPAYLVSTPYGIEIFSGNLDEKAVQGMLESPARQDLAKQLEAGKIGVFVMLSGSQKEENQRVEGVLRQLSQEVADGQISLYVSPGQQVGGGEEESASPGAQHELGLVRVQRDNEQERWFVRTLLAMEPDLKDETRSMVFLIYGRARALLPYIGEGITRENLIREVEFISGACSCTVKEQNPGVDLLVRYDWESAAANVADKFGSEEGNESQFGVDMFFPDLVIPPSETDAAAELASAGIEGDQDVGKADDEETAPVAADSAAGPIVDAASAEVAAAESTESASAPQAASTERVVANANTTAPDDPASLSGTDSSGYGSILIVGAGLAVAMVVLFGLTFLVMRPQ